MSVREAVAAETAATNAAVAAAATAAVAEAAAASKAAAAHEAAAKNAAAANERRGLFRGEVLGVGARVRALAATAPGLLPHLATGCGKAIVTAFGPCTREYIGFGAGCWLSLGGAMGPRCAC